jgi:hypothetical protein
LTVAGYTEEYIKIKKVQLTSADALNAYALYELELALKELIKGSLEEARGKYKG